MQDASALAASALGVAQIDLELLLQLWPELKVDRPSLFEAYLTRD